ncbi:C39 family peptidase, partial [Clostridium tarantellae]
IIIIIKVIQLLINLNISERILFDKNVNEEVLKCNDTDIFKENDDKINEEEKESIYSSTLKEKCIRYYAQDDKRYGDMPYTNSRVNDYTQTIKSSGCGPTAYSIVVSTLNNIDISPPELCKYSLEINTRTDYCGTDKNFFIMAATDINKPNYNLNYEEVNNINRVKILLDDNKHLIIVNMIPGHVTKQGHYIVLSGYTIINGEVYFKVYDPHSINEYYIYDDSLIDSEKDDGFILLSEKVIKLEAHSYFAFSNINDSVVLKINNKKNI